MSGSETLAMEDVFHVIPLSNFARGYDKYSRVYDKAPIAESRYPDRFFVLRADDLGIGIEKTTGLVERIGLDGDRLLVLKGSIDAGLLHANMNTGLGRNFVETRFPVDELFLIDAAGSPNPVSIEEAFAASLKAASPGLIPYARLTPRTLSVLPIARACQASCKFCFSESSASLEQVPHDIPIGRLEALAKLAAAAGASRFVITGGGEPGLVPHEQLLELIVGDQRSDPRGHRADTERTAAEWRLAANRTRQGLAAHSRRSHTAATSRPQLNHQRPRRDARSQRGSARFAGQHCGG